MPRKMTFRSVLTALTVAVVSLCGGVKAIAAQKGGFAVVEARDISAVRPARHDHFEYVGSIAAEVAATDEGADDLAAAPTERAVTGAALSFRGALSSARPAKAEAHQLRHCLVCIRPPTRGPPVKTVVGLTLSAARA